MNASTFIKLLSSSNIVVLKYFTARSGKTTTILPRSIFCAVRTAASIAAPLDMPAKIASLRMISRAMEIASSLSIISCTSICDGS